MSLAAKNIVTLNSFQRHIFPLTVQRQAPNIVKQSDVGRKQ